MTQSGVLDCMIQRWIVIVRVGCVQGQDLELRNSGDPVGCMNFHGHDKLSYGETQIQVMYTLPVVIVGCTVLSRVQVGCTLERYR